jgi:hypothetical protein
MIPEKAAAGSVPVPANEGAPDTHVPRLTRLQFWVCIGVALMIFAFVTGPVWAHPWNMNVLDVAIYVSYIPIPLMVIAVLAWRRSLTFRGAFLDILEMVLLKYAITFTFALCLWAVADEPALARAFPLVPRAPATQEALPAPSIIAPESTGTLEGTAVDESGRPIADALIFVESGLEAYSFAPPTEPVYLENNGSGITPRLAAAQSGQRIFARSTDGHLHTFVAGGAGSAILNVPLLSGGSWTPVEIRGSVLIATLTCSVHQQAGNEERAHLGVFAHPFFAITGADGRFKLASVPAGSLRVGGFHRERGTIRREARVDPGASANVSMDFAAPR